MNDFETIEHFDYVSSRYDRTIGFTTVNTETKIWRNGTTGFVDDSVQIFADGSKLNRAIDIIIYSEPFGISSDIHFPSVDIAIFSNSQAVVKVLSIEELNAETVNGCH